ncbi:MAG: hypothetical protein M0Q44_14150 [Methylobacter sp.]|jgi:hypothetical protein|nr:hypothetical protein [Methylobacter sp.]
MALKKTSFYHTRNKVAPNKQQAAELLGVEISEIERMDKEGAPIMAKRLLLLWDKKHINAPGWDDWVFSRGALIHKNKCWRPENLMQLRQQDERIYQLESELYQLKSFKGMIKIAIHLI